MRPLNPQCFAPAKPPIARRRFGVRESFGPSTSGVLGFGRDPWRFGPCLRGVKATVDGRASKPCGPSHTQRKPGCRRSAFLLLGLCALPVARAQFVNVTLKLDAARVNVGATTTLRVFGQVVPDKRAATDRIFSWYVDLLNEGATVARADYTKLEKPTADKDPRTSSGGATDGPHRRGIYDTFLNRGGAGVSEPVELFNVPVTGLAAGRARFRVQAGSGVSGLAADFIVAPKGGGPPLLGGIYDAASLELQVVETAACTPRLGILREPAAGGQHKVTLSFTPCPGRTHIVEFRDSLTTGSWLPLPGAPHNSGVATETTGARVRFYRVRVQ